MNNGQNKTQECCKQPRCQKVTLHVLCQNKNISDILVATDFLLKVSLFFWYCKGKANYGAK